LHKTSPKGFSASKCDVGNWIFSKSWNCLRFFFFFIGGIFWGIFRGFIGGMVLENFLGGIFLEDFFGGICFGGIFLEELFGRNSLFTFLKLFEYEKD
jgi:hypothetical protein